MGKTEGPHDEDGFYTCPCGTDRNGKPYNRRSVMHAHSDTSAEQGRAALAQTQRAERNR
jgi:hypothetical protein